MQYYLEYNNYNHIMFSWVGDKGDRGSDGEKGDQGLKGTRVYIIVCLWYKYNSIVKLFVLNGIFIISLTQPIQKYS